MFNLVKYASTLFIPILLLTGLNSFTAKADSIANKNHSYFSIGIDPLTIEKKTGVKPRISAPYIIKTFKWKLKGSQFVQADVDEKGNIINRGIFGMAPKELEEGQNLNLKQYNKILSFEGIETSSQTRLDFRWIYVDGSYTEATSADGKIIFSMSSKLPKYKSGELGKPLAPCHSDLTIEMEPGTESFFEPKNANGYYLLKKGCKTNSITVVASRCGKNECEISSINEISCENPTAKFSMKSFKQSKSYICDDAEAFAQKG